MCLSVVFLGTAGSVPTLRRNLPAVLVKRKGELVMFDCGEGVQRQMMKAKTGFCKKMKILVSHMHGDHVLGLPGLLQTMALLDRERKLEVYGPSGMKRFLEAIEDSLQFVLTFPVEIYEIEKAGIVCDEEEYALEALWSSHVIPSLAYALIEKPRPGKFYPEKALILGIPEGPLWSKLQQGQEVELTSGQVIRPEQVLGASRAGRKVVYTGDTKSFEGLVEFAADADLLIHDATFADELAEKAGKDGHSTPSQAAKAAQQARVRQLILTHISARYEDPCILQEQAQRIFRNTKMAEDFMEIEIPFRKAKN